MKEDKLLKIVYEENKDFILIRSDDFCITYGNGLGGHGLQCYYEGGTDRYNKIESLLDDISDKVRLLHKLATEDMEDKA